MFGYVLPVEEKLSEHDKARFRSVYCGLCHTMGKKYGLFSRFLLNYDFTFLAIMLSGAEEPSCSSCRCVAHPCKSRCVMDKTPALEIAANRSVILSWWQLRDHVADSGFVKSLLYRAASLLLRSAYRKACAEAPEFDRSVERHLAELSALEAAHCASVDEAAEPFAALMGDIALDLPDARQSRILQQIFYHLGRWIYLIDAADDYEKDRKSGNYNPLRYRYALVDAPLGAEEKQALGATLDQSIERMASAYALCDYGVWTPILDSIFYLGFYGIGNAVLAGTYHAQRRKRKKKQTEELL
ncbi:MAG: hypothetical protein IKL99_03190 [Oscillospiraceae bacterium]|nr:hypothetical protein [Oscillospiraceae bacterium]